MIDVNNVIERCKNGFDSTSNVDEINSLLADCLNLILSNEKNRTKKQSDSRWVYLKKIADAFNEKSIDRSRLVKTISDHPKVNSINTQQTIYYDYWKPIHDALYPQKKRLSSEEIGKVYEAMNNHCARTFGISFDFPSQDLR